MIKVDISELDQFVVDLGKLSNETDDNVKKTLRNSAFNIEKEAKSNLTSNKSVRTGHLRGGIATNIRDLEATIHTSNIKYASGVEFGTKAHIIKAKNKKALYWKGASHPVKSVKHPGGKAKPYLIPAFEKEKNKFFEKLKEAIEW